MLEDVMDDELFVRTMIEVLKFDKKYSGKKDDLLPILRRVTLNRKPQWGFVRHGRPNQRYEDIELRIPVPLLNEANNQYDDLYDIINYVYEESDEYALGELTFAQRLFNPKMLNTRNMMSCLPIFKKKLSKVSGMRGIPSGLQWHG